MERRNAIEAEHKQFTDENKPAASQQERRVSIDEEEPGMPRKSWALSLCSSMHSWWHRPKANGNAAVQPLLTDTAPQPSAPSPGG